MNFTRRQILAAAGLAGSGAALLGALRFWPEQGLFNPCLGPLPESLAGHPLVREAWQGLDPSEVWDSHAHLLGVGDGPHADGASTNDAHGTWRWPLAAVQRRFFLNAACIDSGAPIDATYVERLRALVDAMPSGHKLVLLALDAFHDELGRLSPERTHVRVSNGYCAAVAKAAPHRFEWVASVHPYRADALEELHRVVRLGARGIKWIPAAQGINPGEPRCDAFYAALAKLELPLITHAGDERATPGDDALGNPLHLRRALDHGVRVVIAHCASMGQSPDIDLGAQKKGLPRVDNFALFERLMDEPRYARLLYGDLSAMTQSARAGAALRRVLERGSEGGGWSQRLLNGSDYPIPAIMPLYSLRDLVADGMLDASAVEPLSAIRRHHPLLFDFVLKRQLRLGGRRLALSVFRTRDFFAPDAKRRIASGS